MIKPNSKFGEAFKNQINERLDNPEDPDLGKRNIDIMENLVNEMR